MIKYVKIIFLKNYKKDGHSQFYSAFKKMSRFDKLMGGFCCSIFFRSTTYPVTTKTRPAKSSSWKDQFKKRQHHCNKRRTREYIIELDKPQNSFSFHHNKKYKIGRVSCRERV